MFDIVLPLFVFLIGLSAGSFVNVLVFRFGFTESPAPRSHCMACDAPLLWYDLVPIVSFFMLRGRCRSCGSALSLQYPVVEFLLGALFLGALLVLPPVLSLWSVVSFTMLLVFLCALIALALYDIRHTLVPLPFIYALIGSALAASASNAVFVHSFEPLIESFLGGFALLGFFLAIVLLTGGRGMGMGDAYIAGAAGLLLGLLRGIEAIMFGVWSATIVYLVIFFLSSLNRKKPLFPSSPRVTIKTELPFVPFLAFGIILALFTGLSPLAAGEWLTQLLWFGH